MDNKSFLDLLQKICKNPSILFLGQNYLSSEPGQEDVFLLSLSKELRKEITSYDDMYEALKKRNKITQNNLNFAGDVSRSLQSPMWLNNVVALQWDGIITDALDGALLHCGSSNRYLPSPYLPTHELQGMSRELSEVRREKRPDPAKDVSVSQREAAHNFG